LRSPSLPKARSRALTTRRKTATTHWIEANPQPREVRMTGSTELIPLVPIAERKAPAPTAANAHALRFSVALPAYFPFFIEVFS
jgi:hypothetical protein